MLARALKIGLAFELAIYVALGTWLNLSLGWSVLGAAALVIGFGIAARVGFGLGTYVVAWRFRSDPPPALKRSALVAPVAQEIAAMAVVYNILQPFERCFMGSPEPPRERAQRLPILLVHGYVCNRAACWSLARRLRRRGEVVWPVTLEPLYGSIETWVRPLSAAIDALLAHTGAARVIVIAHSMGGLAMRAWLRDHGPAKVARLITLGSPHQGSALARLGQGINAREMEPGSAWLAALAREEAQTGAAPITSIMSHHDNFVAPQTSAVHPTARTIELAGIGHLTMLFAAEVFELIVQELDSANAAAPGRSLSTSSARGVSGAHRR